jgi:hypothetical protein
MSALVFLAGAVLLVWTVRAWRPGLDRRVAVAYLVLTTAFFALPLLGGRLQIGSDIPYVFLPWSDEVAAGCRPANVLAYDVVLQMLPYRTLVRQRLLAGEAPLWAHELGTGQPLLGNAQSAPFAPLHLLALPLPPVRALTVAAAWQMLLGLLLMHALARALGAGTAGAALAAVGFAWSTFEVAWMLHPHAMVAAWLPGVLLGILALWRGEPRAFAGLVVCALGVALSGHPETAAHGALAAAAVAGALLLRGRARSGLPARSAVAPDAVPEDVAEDRRGRSLQAEWPGAQGPGVEQVGVERSGVERSGVEPAGPAGPGRREHDGRPESPQRWRLVFAGRLAAAAVLAGCLAAPVLLPVAEAVPRSERAWRVAHDPDGIQPASFERRFLSVIVSPLAFGTPLDGVWAGPPRTNYVELCSAYAGLATLALAVAGALTLGGRIAALLAGGALALVAALRVPPLFALVRLLPLVGEAPIGRLRLLWVLAVALAAGLALERLAAVERGRRAVAAALLAAALGAAVLLPPLPGTPWQHAAWLAAVAAVAATLAALLVPSWRRRFPAVAAVGVAAELFVLGGRYQPAVAPSFNLAPPPALAFLASQARGAAGPFRVAAVGRDLHANLGALYGLWDPRGNEPMRPVAAARLAARLLDPAQPVSDQLALGLPAGLPGAGLGLDFLALRFLLLSHDSKLPPPWRLAFDGRGGRVWENPRALPLFFLPHQVVEVRDDAAALDRALEEPNLGTRAFRAGQAAVARDGPGTLGGTAEERGSERSGEVPAVHRLSNGFELRVRSPTGGLVASSVSYAPGWRAAVDGGPWSAALTVDGAFLGFTVPPGDHRVRLDYRPLGWVLGRWLAAGAAALAVLVWLAARQGRRLH